MEYPMLPGAYTAQGRFECCQVLSDCSLDEYNIANPVPTFDCPVRIQNRVAVV